MRCRHLSEQAWGWWARVSKLGSIVEIGKLIRLGEGRSKVLDERSLGHLLCVSELASFRAEELAVCCRSAAVGADIIAKP